MMMAPVHAVFFDAVGTLIRPEPPAHVVYQEVGQRFGSQVPSDEILVRFNRAFQTEDELDRTRNWRTSEAREVERWQRIVAAVLDDVADPGACFRELFAYFSRAEAWRTKPDADSVLRELGARGYQLGMASNYDKRLRSVMARLPALAPIRHLVISSELGWRKPARQFFQAMCDTVGLPPQQILYVGDDRINDFEGARGASLQAVLFDPGEEGSSTVPRIQRLAELLPLLSGS